MQSRVLNCCAEHKILNDLLLILVGSLFIALSAQITIPLQPIPVTLQSSAVLFIGMIFGPKIGGKIIFVYLLEGLIGLPIFANFLSGPAILMGTSGGYLLGFLPGAILSGYLLQRGWAKYRLTTFFAALIGTITLFTPGYLVLAQFVGYHNAYLFGVKALYATEFCKIMVLTLIVPFFWKA